MSRFFISDHFVDSETKFHLSRFQSLHYNGSTCDKYRLSVSTPLITVKKSPDRTNGNIKLRQKMKACLFTLTWRHTFKGYLGLEIFKLMSLVDSYSLFNGFLLSTLRKPLYKVERQLKLFTQPNSFIFLKHYKSYF